MTEKNPFVKLRSQLEKRKIFDRLIESGVELICKAEGENLITLTDLRHFHETHIMGRLKVNEGAVSGKVDIIGSFQAGETKYFFLSACEVVGQTVSFPIGCDLYELQRRSFPRLSVIGKKEVPIKLEFLNERPILVHGTVVDISIGGARALFSQDSSAAWKLKSKELKVGDQIQGSIHFSENKILSFDAILRHQSKKPDANKDFLGEYGFEFLNLSPSQRNRLQMVTLEMQRKFFVHQG